MSAHRYTDTRIDCDWLNCGKSEFGGNLDIAELTAAQTRKVLKKRGWKVGLPAPVEGDPRRDYCPEHAARLS